MTHPAQTECLADRLVIGDVVGEKYRIESVLGKGGMGIVVSAVHLHLDEKVALKFLTGSADRVPDARARFLREARITAKLKGEHAARVSDFGALEDGTPFMVMEFLDGVDLRQLLVAHGALPVQVAVHYVVQACEGLAEAHALGIVHRDLKPSNIFLTRRPDGTDLVKLVDFGISKVRAAQEGQDVELTAAGALLGSPKYVAPEQLRDSGCVDARADVWSLGAILYEMLSGRPPFDGESAASLCYVILGDRMPEPLAGTVEGVSKALEDAVFRCLSRDLEKRTPDVAAVVADLHGATGLAGLDEVSRGIASVLAKGSGDGATAFGLSGSYPGTRAKRALAGTDSGSVRSLEISGGTEPGVAASQFPLAARRGRMGLGVGVAFLLAGVLAVGMWSRFSGESLKSNAGVGEGEPLVAPPVIRVEIADPAAEREKDGAAEEAAVEASALEAAREEAGAARRDPVSQPVRPVVRPSKPPADTPKEEPKKPLNPFGDRY